MISCAADEHLTEINQLGPVAFPSTGDLRARTVAYVGSSRPVTMKSLVVCAILVKPSGTLLDGRS